MTNLTRARTSKPDACVWASVIAVCLCAPTLPAQSLVELVSLNNSGIQGNRSSLMLSQPALSGTGQFVVFASSADNLVNGDTNGVVDVFVRDRTMHSTSRVTQTNLGVQGNDESYDAAISNEGRFVAFSSKASNLVPDDANDARDVFVRDLLTGVIRRVSVSSDGTEAARESGGPAISADGCTIAFHSFAPNLVLHDLNHASDVFVHDCLDRSTNLVSISSGSVQGNGASTGYGIAISADGRVIAFQSAASNLVPGDTNAMTDIFLRDRLTETTSRISVSSHGTQANGSSFDVALSADGRYVAFQSRASNLVPDDTNSFSDVFVHDRLTGETTRVSLSTAGNEHRASVVGYEVAISGDGRFVVFDSNAPDLTTNDGNGHVDVFIHDRNTGVTRRVSADSTGADANSYSAFAAISRDGKVVAFNSVSSNLVSADANQSVDTFVTRDADFDGQAGAAFGGPDCNDNESAIYPGATEICDMRDNNCNGVVDETFPLGCADVSADLDGDALLDVWEVYGFDSNADGVPDVDLPRMGANPLRKDVFVEVDYMETTSGPSAHSDLFSLESYARVQRAYLMAPTTNPDGIDGISLHVDAGPMSVMNPRTGALWHGRSQANAIGHATDSDINTAIEAAYNNQLASRERLFHYALAGHSLRMQLDTSCDPDVEARFNGISQIHGRHSISTLGATAGEVVELGGFVPGVRDVVQEAGLFMHELGHNMGLGHGGPCSGVSAATCHRNRKPHYFSVMNYSFGYRGLHIDSAWGHQDYSRFDLATLDESALSEPTGLGPGAAANYGTLRYCGDLLSSSLNCVSDPSVIVKFEPNLSAPIDWNCNTTIDAEPVGAEINLSVFKERTTLLSINDWQNLTYDGAGTLGASQSTQTATASTLPPDEPTDEQLRGLLPNDYGVIVASEGIKVRSPGHNERHRFAVINTGNNADTYTITVQSSNVTFADVARVPRTLSLQPGATEIVYIPTSVANDARRATRYTLTLRAESQANPLFAAIGTSITVVSSVRPTARAGPDRTAEAGSVLLDGSRSESPTRDPLRYVWTGPFREGGGIAYGRTARVTLPKGQHTITLVVNDGVVDSEPDTVRIRSK